MQDNHHADIGLIGLAVMGQNLVLNMIDHGFKVAVFNRTTQVMRDFMAQHPEKHAALVGCASLDALVQALKPPRKIILLVKAGAAVDEVIEQLCKGGLARDDIVVDCGNSRWTDTIRRSEDYAERCQFMDSGISGGEVGARYGPSLMPAGSKTAWQSLQPIWEAIAARVEEATGTPLEAAHNAQAGQEGVPCTAYIGEHGAGHYVKMIHNGIEYVDMQLISEAYALMHSLLGLQPEALASIFKQWNDGVLHSYLMEITADILQQRDPDHPEGFLVDYILDTASHKGTGKWTSVNALDMGMPANTIAEAVFARFLSAQKEERVEASQQLEGPQPAFRAGRDRWLTAIESALYCAKICAYAQGFQLMQASQQEYQWTLDLASIARLWRGGCIIRARLLQHIAAAYQRDPHLSNLLLDPWIKTAVQKHQDAWRSVVMLAAQGGIAAPALMASLAYYDGYRSARLPTNLIQAQRDYFGAHTYERTDQPRGSFFHLDWPAEKRSQKAISAS